MIETDEEVLLRTLTKEVTSQLDEKYLGLFESPMLIGGSGESSQPQGLLSLLLEPLFSTDPHVTTGAPQSMDTQTNKNLFDCFTRQNPVAVFLNRKSLYGSLYKEKTDGDPVVHLAYYAVEGMQTNMSLLSETIASVDSMKFSSQSARLAYIKNNLYNYSFRRNCSLSYQMVPAFPLETFVKIVFDGLVETDYRPVRISTRDNRPVTVLVSKVQQSILSMLRLAAPPTALLDGLVDAAIKGTPVALDEDPDSKVGG